MSRGRAYILAAGAGAALGALVTLCVIRVAGGMFDPLPIGAAALLCAALGLLWLHAHMAMRARITLRHPRPASYLPTLEATLFQYGYRVTLRSPSSLTLAREPGAIERALAAAFPEFRPGISVMLAHESIAIDAPFSMDGVLRRLRMALRGGVASPLV